MEDLRFDSTDLAATEDFLTKAYTSLRIGGHGRPTRARIDRRWLGPVSLDSLSFSFDMQFNVLPLHKVLIGRVHSGHIETRFGSVRNVLAPGDVALIAPPEAGYTGQVSTGAHDATMLDVGQLDRVASPMDSGGHVVLTGHRPVSPTAGAHLNACVGYLRDRVLADQSMRDSHLVASTAAMHLAAVVLNTFPSNAHLEPTSADRTGAKATMLRRAVAFIDESAHLDISISDIAKHLSMTPRGGPYLLRRAHDWTPKDYLRRVRLEHAHMELLGADPDTTSVGAIATRWGFAHKGRFARHYRQTYGLSPHQTLSS